MQGCACPTSRWDCHSFLLPKHARSQLSGFQPGVGGREWKGRSIRYLKMKHPRCEARGQVVLHERKVAVFVYLENAGGEAWHAQRAVSLFFSSRPKVQLFKSLKKDGISQHFVDLTNSSHCLPKSYSSQNTPGDTKASRVRVIDEALKGIREYCAVHFLVFPKLLHRILGVPQLDYAGKCQI